MIVPFLVVIDAIANEAGPVPLGPLFDQRGLSSPFSLRVSVGQRFPSLSLGLAIGVTCCLVSNDRNEADTASIAPVWFVVS